MFALAGGETCRTCHGTSGRRAPTRVPAEAVSMPRKIAVKGTSGAGKSTFAAELAHRLGLAYVELDALHHGPNWSAPSAAEFRARVGSALAAAPQGWVVDGNYD